VNVVFTPGGGGAAETIPRDDPCTGGTGWHYDNAAEPKRIILCPGTCQQFKQDLTGKVQIELGCKTVVK
jgi:hypothetical protein